MKVACFWNKKENLNLNVLLNNLGFKIIKKAFFTLEGKKKWTDHVHGA